MSKETTAGVVCQCGQTIYYSDQHWQHCPEKDSWQIKTKLKEEKGGGKRKSRGKRVEARDIRESNGS